MKIYHGSLEVIERSLILQPNRLLDYGKGFYTTTSERQAKEWVERRMIENNTTCGYVNVYEFNEERLTDLKRLTFSEPTKEWADFVMANRTQKGFIHDYDIVYGPVANDRVYLQFGLYETGAISVETLIRELKTYKLVDQYLFHTEKALTALHFIESIKNMFQISQNNLHLLLPGKISWLVEYLHEDYGFTLQESLHRIYHSKLYKKLSTEKTKYWHLGPVDLYNELKEEL